MRRSEGSAFRAPFGENLRGALRKRRMTNKALAAKLGVADGTVSMWIHGKASPDIGTAVRIAELLDMTLQELIVGEPRPADGDERNALRALAVSVIEDTREIYPMLQQLNRHARQLERWAKKHRVIEEEEE